MLFSRIAARRSAWRTIKSFASTEPLEVRILPTVTATVSNGTLTLLGDQTANDITIEQSGADLHITGNNGTLVSFNGIATDQATISGVQNLKGTFGQLSDAIKFEDGIVLNKVTLNLGGGSNDLEFRDSTINGLLTVTGGNEGDKVEFDASTLNAVTLNLVNGNDEVKFLGSTFNGTVSINTTNGIDKIETALGTGGVVNTFLGAVTIKTGNQADEIKLANATFAGLTIDTGADNDEIELTTLTITGKLTVDGGSGNDEITLDGVIQAGTGLNVIRGLSGKDDVKIKTTTFASAVSIDMGSGPMNELEIDDVGFAAATTIFSNGVNDELRIEQDLGRSGLTNFGGAVSIQMGPGGTIGLAENNGASYVQAAGAVTIKGSKPLLVATIAEVRVSFALPPVFKNAEFVLV